MRWLLGAIALLAIGITFQLGLLVYAMYVLLGVMLVSRILAHDWIANVEVTRECSRVSAEIGDKVAVIVNFRNRGWLPIPWLLVEDSVPSSALLQKPPRIALNGRRVAIFQLGSQGTHALRYQVTFKGRGYFQLGPTLFESGDLFGLHRRFRVATHPTYVLVYPRVVPIPGYDLASRRPVGEIRLTHRLFEDPSRIAGVREYRRGDPLNRIHWKSTARTGVLHSKVFEPSCVAGVTVLLDFHQSNYPPVGEPYRSDLAVTTALSLSNAVYELGQQIGLVTNGRDAADRIRTEGMRNEFRTRSLAMNDVEMNEASDRLRPVIVETRRGESTLQRLRESLARLELTTGLTFAGLVQEASSHFPRDATIAAVLAGISMETAVVLSSLRQQGWAVSAVLIMPDEIADREAIGQLIGNHIPVRTITSEADIANLSSEPWMR